MARKKSVASGFPCAGYTGFRGGRGLPVCAAIGAVCAGVHCEPADEGPAPGTAQAQLHEPGAPPPNAPPMPTAPPPGVTLEPTAPPPGFSRPAGASPAGSSSPSASTGTPPVSYASGEYTIGVDPDGYDDDDPSALTDFRSALDPNGSWADDPTYGMVWTPAAEAVGSGFAPYVSSGHWAFDDDWVWVSDYSWGWAPFHYGRWVFIAGRGWSWVPGRTYRGAWVSWAVDDGYGILGWAPLAPEFVWVGGVATAWHGVRAPSFVYCPRGAVFATALGAKVMVGPAAVAIAPRMHPYIAVTAGGRAMAGPPPARLGYRAAEVPMATGAGAAGVERAEQFARRSTTTSANAGPDAGRR